jgi:preprotein translocase subunit SecB
MTTTNGGPPDQSQPQLDQSQPQLECLAQYIKDFSFENPNAPRSLAPTQNQPQINVQVNVAANPLAPSDVEVVLNLEGKAEAAGTVLYSFELSFAGVFRLTNIPQDMLQQIAMVDCPHLLFPFAREIIASAVSNSSFPPLLLAPINFFGLYQQQLGQIGNQAQAAPKN